MTPAPTPKEINGWNRAFWVDQQGVLEQRLQNPALRAFAEQRIIQEELLGMPVRHRQTLEATLEDAERLVTDEGNRIRSTEFPQSLDAALEQAKREGKAQRSQRAKKAAQARRPDPLQKLIIDFARQNPKITGTQLLHHLKREVGQGTIKRIDDENIYSWAARDGEAPVPIRGLKDRLSRAKKIIRATAASANSL